MNIQFNNISSSFSKIVCTAFIFFTCQSNINAQLSAGGNPPSFQNNLPSNIPVTIMPPVDNDSLLQIDSINQINSGHSPYQYGYPINVNLGISNAGRWDTLGNGDRIWRLMIASPGAKTINLIYNSFWLPQGALFYVYNKDKTNILGAFTFINNKSFGKFATGLVQGDTIILELFEPSNVYNLSQLNVSKVIHAYKNVGPFQGNPGASGSCNINVRCPLGLDWCIESRAVVLITDDNGAFCSGAMINNVNNGTSNTGPCTNCAYYINNGDGSTPPCDTDSLCIQFDGRTVVLEAVYPVQCSQTYHIKLAIADAGDAAWDSGVFLESGSFSSAGVQVSVTTVTGDSTIIEGCTDATFTFTRSDTTSDITIYFNIAGNAINGLDFDSIADSIVINQGSFSVDLVIFPIFDTIIEGIDTIIITVFNITACGDTIPETAVIFIAEDYVLTVTANDVTTCPGNTIALIAAASGGIAPYDFFWSDGQSGDTIFVTTPVTDTLIVSVIDSCGLKIAVDTVIVNIYPLSDTSTVSNVSCNGGNDGSATVFPIGGKAPFTFSWSSGGSDSTETGLATGTFFVTITDSNGCIISDSVLITQPDSLALAATKVDAACDSANGIATVSVSGGTAPYTYLWNDFLTQTDSIADSLAPGVYWVIVTDSLGCVDSVSAIINAPTGFSATISDSINISCFGANDGSATVTVNGGTPPFTYQWFDSAGDTIAGQTDTIAINLPPGTYTVAVEGTDSLSCIAFQIVPLTGPTELKDSLISIQKISR
ncbi:MAG: SprB repeat-containing protein [Bacteroidetes bacterium]|nr:SprB repeat-containing protein [Bacteroidota bacterium]